MKFVNSAVAACLLVQASFAFVPDVFVSSSRGKMRQTLGSRADKEASCLFAKKGKSSSGKGFGKKDSGKSYGSVTKVIKDVIDTEAAMNAFFSTTNDAWFPLLRSLAADAGVPAMDFLGGTHGEEIEFHENSSPWTQLQALPDSEEDKVVIASFLDSMQQNLLDIPVNERTQDDADDLHFLEEGRRILAITRFHVLPGISGGSVEHHEELFKVCWSELHELRRADETGTGSVILLPDYDFDDLRRFTDMNLQRPLDWLGRKSLFEVASMQRAVPAIRILHKLEDMPEDEYKGPVGLEDLL